jgi:hypothetical protein
MTTTAPTAIPALAPAANPALLPDTAPPVLSVLSGSGEGVDVYVTVLDGGAVTVAAKKVTTLKPGAGSVADALSEPWTRSASPGRVLRFLDGG